MNNKSKLLILILYHILLFLVFRLAFTPHNDESIYPTYSANISCYRLNNEPTEPINIDDPPFNYGSYPSEIFPVSTVFSEGYEIPLQFIYNNQDWQRPAYKDYWHSSVSAGRWSYVPHRIHYAMHRLFSTYPTASVSYDFAHDLGIWDEYLEFDKSYQNNALTPFDYIEIVIMQTNVQKVITYGNQIVIVGKPQLTGLQAIIIPVEEISPIHNDNSLLIQLVTPEGDIIDNTITAIVESENTN